MSCGKTELCIFDRPTPQVVVDTASFEEIFPLNTISGDDVDIEFKIQGSNTHYLDLNDTLLYVETKVVKEDGNTLDTTVTPANYFFHSLFKDIIVTMNSQQIEGGNNSYAHKAILESILNYSSDTEAIHLEPMGCFYKEDTRQKWVDKSKPYRMCGSLLLDFFNQPKYLIPGVNVHLRLQRTQSSFCLFGKGKVQITDAKLYVRRVKVEQSVLMGHQLGLQKQNAVYPIRKSRFISYSVPKGSLDFYKDQIFGDVKLPNFILVTFQPTAALNGDFTQKASEYKNYDVQSITLSRNNDYREMYNTDFENNNFVTAYMQSIVRNMGNLNKNMNNGIDLLEFKTRYPFFTFVLSPDFDINQTQIPKQGNLRLDIKFKKALPEPASVIVYGVFDSEIQISKSRAIIS